MRLTVLGVATLAWHTLQQVRLACNVCGACAVDGAGLQQAGLVSASRLRCFRELEHFSPAVPHGIQLSQPHFCASAAPGGDGAPPPAGQRWGATGARSPGPGFDRREGPGAEPA
eukprot:CAMPEP_0168357422 /NCGR_PEP_ID=MMETSP0228-20121227/577_1 /TAXON_ID=133427 /ORGANISM="Protoceratium reticulatum, Strain CCCM 535 (=CCMP 1889)" /LENGTH=113 /DNA_ID=CAMNT_0008369937 /DNA_START=23 /DNA_END=362 /DNA_ORIENTATION=-